MRKRIAHRRPGLHVCHSPRKHPAMALIRVYSRDNAAGLSRDLRLVEQVLAAAGHDVEAIGFGNEKGINALRSAGLRAARLWRGRADAQVFVERVLPDLLPLGRRNLLLPNPEWFPDEWRALLPRFDAVLCKTRHAVGIFAALGCATRHVGFTSEDRMEPGVPRERAFFHLAGRSVAKGTQVLLDAWRRHPEWPRLTVVQSARRVQTPVVAPNIDHRIGHLADAELRSLQNRHAFHACPSEMEGFGHSLMEAMSVAACTIATDGAPMNELVGVDRGWLVAPASTGRCDLSPQFFVDVAGIERAVAGALACDDGELRAKSTAARAHFVQADREFRRALPAAVLD
jgi:hypothetical protein